MIPLPWDCIVSGYSGNTTTCVFLCLIRRYLRLSCVHNVDRVLLLQWRRQKILSWLEKGLDFPTVYWPGVIAYALMVHQAVGRTKSSLLHLHAYLVFWPGLKRAGRDLATRLGILNSQCT